MPRRASAVCRQASPAARDHRGGPMAATPKKRHPRTTGRTLDARRDTLDFRDRMYVPTLVEVPPYRALDDYRKRGVPILDQGQEGACTGFGLATVAHYL